MDPNGIEVNMTPSHPGDFIRTELVEELGLSESQVAETLGVSHSALSDLLAGKSDLSREIALRIERSYGIGMDLLLRMQDWHNDAALRVGKSDVPARRP